MQTDRNNSPPVVVVSERFAQRYLGSEAIGKRIQLLDKDSAWAEVVGVAANAKHFSVFEPALDFVYLPLSQNGQDRMTMIVETSGEPADTAQPLRQMIRSMNPNVPISGVRTMDDLFNQRSVRVTNIVVGQMAALGLMGLTLALVGLYAVVSYQVSRRTREIGIRMAIGAARLQVLKLIVKQAAVMAVIGVSLGLAFSIVAARAVAASLGAALGQPLQVFNILVFGSVPLLLLATATVAAVIPARRAAQVDPMEALRQD
jgi:putative ABC transport system permease protein